MSRHSPSRSSVAKPKRQRSRDSATRDRIVDEALRLFAERGYRNTSVSDIQAASGLSSRSGALYKHFSSKKEVLEAGVERGLAHLEGVRTARRLVPEFGTLREEAEILGRFILIELDAERELLKVLLKEGDQFGDVLSKARTRLIRPAYEEFAAWLGRHVDGDVEAMAAVAFGAIMQYRVIEELLGEPPGGLDEERFLQAWVSMMEGLAE